MNTLQNLSFKKYKMWKLCPFQLKLKYLDKEPELPVSEKGEIARQRGIKMHEEMEACIRGEGPLPPYAEKFKDIVEALIANGAQAEVDMFFDEHWRRQETWDGHWLQVKQDVLAETDEFVLTGDWKSGKRFGNEYWHFKQMELYSVAAWRAMPGYSEYVAELYYLDKDDVWTVTFTPQQLEKAFGVFDAEFDKMLNEKLFRPRPNIDTCRFCPYNKKGTGVCPVAVNS